MYFDRVDTYYLRDEVSAEFRFACAGFSCNAGKLPLCGTFFSVIATRLLAMSSQTHDGSQPTRVSIATRSRMD